MISTIKAFNPGADSAGEKLVQKGGEGRVPGRIGDGMYLQVLTPGTYNGQPVTFSNSGRYSGWYQNADGSTDYSRHFDIRNDPKPIKQPTPVSPNPKLEPENPTDPIKKPFPVFGPINGPFPVIGHGDGTFEPDHRVGLNPVNPTPDQRQRQIEMDDYNNRLDEWFKQNYDSNGRPIKTPIRLPGRPNTDPIRMQPTFPKKDVRAFDTRNNIWDETGHSRVPAQPGTNILPDGTIADGSIKGPRPPLPLEDYNRKGEGNPTAPYSKKPVITVHGEKNIGGNTANPAAVYAKQQGYEYIRTEGPLGQDAMVLRPGRIPTNQWDVYREEVSSKKAPLTKPAQKQQLFGQPAPMQQVPFNNPQPVSSGVWGAPKANSVLKKNQSPYSTRRGI